ncbi:hypothetical protein ACOMHN_036433 [Nucella lapillus]
MAAAPCPQKTQPGPGTSSAAKQTGGGGGKGEKGKREAEEFEFFYGNKSPFSQHHPVKFDIEGITYTCAEQYMMHQKAVLFKDPAMAKKILATSNPVEQKRCGRKVKNFDKDVWNSRSKQIVKNANLAKFSQNPELLTRILATHPRTLVEASPRDRTWGIGLGASNPKARDRSCWRGRNLLGQILTEVREELREEEEEEEEGKRGGGGKKREKVSEQSSKSK